MPPTPRFTGPPVHLSGSIIIWLFAKRPKTPPPRAHYGIFKNGSQIAEASSGSLSPTLGVGIGMAYVPTEFARINEQIEIEIRGKRFPAQIEKKPLHRAGTAGA